MGSLEKRLENVERRVEGTHRPVRINVVYEDACEEVLYTVTMRASQEDESSHPDEEGAS
jgi:hypothetical protein